jgi:type IV pilus assembly protein PilE
MAAQIGKIGCAMNTFLRKQAKGFTVIELMIVLVIVAILVALAYPSYINYVRKAKRGEAQQLLLNWSINQEIWRSNNTAYNGTDDLKPSHDLYDFGVAADATSYTLTATGKGDQVNDYAKDGVTKCTLTLNQDGVKAPPACWD